MNKPKTPLLLEDLIAMGEVQNVIFESLEQALYRLEIEHEGAQYYVIEKPGKSLTRRSLVDMQSLLIPLTVGAMFVRHSSPYDEMIGQDTVAGGNEMLVPVGNFFQDMPNMVKH